MPPLSKLHHIRSAIGFVGLQVVFVTLSGEGVGHLRAIGLQQSEVAILLLSGPLCGAIFQLYFERWSDQVHTRWGKRKPFIMVGVFFLVLALLCLAWVEPIAKTIVPITLLGDVHHSSIVIVAEFSMFTIWVSIQAIQVGLRALITDDCPHTEQAYANAWASRYANLAGAIANLVAYLDVLPRQSKLDSSLGTFQSMSLLASATLLITTSISCYAKNADGNEMPSQDENPDMSLPQIWRTFFKPESQIRTICLVQVFAWMGWFPFLFYIVTLVNQLQHQELVRTGLPSIIIEHSDPRRGLLAYSIFGFASLASAIIIPPLVTQWNVITVRRLWMISNGVLAVFLMSAFFSSASAPLVILCGVVGFSWAISGWVPYVLIGAAISLAVNDNDRLEYALDSSPDPKSAKRGKVGARSNESTCKDVKDISKHAGLLYGIHNLAISFPQIVF